MLILYQFPISHYCEKIRWALDYKAIEYSIVNLMPGAHIKIIRSMAPKTEVPLVQAGNEIIQGSATIISSLDEHFPQQPLTPADEKAKAQTLEWEAYVDEQVGPYLRLFYYHYYLERPDLLVPLLVHGQPWYKRSWFRLIYPRVRDTIRRFLHISDRTAEIALKKLQRAIEKLADQYQQHDFLVGDQFSRADLAAAAMLAPICTPIKYGLQWPPLLPGAMQEAIGPLRERLFWVDRLYQNYR